MKLNERQAYLHNFVKTNMTTYTIRLNTLPNEDITPKQYIDQLLKIKTALHITTSYLDDLTKESKGDLKYESQH